MRGKCSKEKSPSLFDSSSRRDGFCRASVKEERDGVREGSLEFRIFGRFLKIVTRKEKLETISCVYHVSYTNHSTRFNCFPHPTFSTNSALSFLSLICTGITPACSQNQSS